MISQELHEKFLTRTEDSGRFIVTSHRTGKTYYVEPIGDPRREWGSVYPGEKDLHHKKGDGKHRGSVTEKESIVSEANGFTKVTTLEAGTSPLAAIDFLDAQYPDKST
jgi:hypothetical protein